MQPLGRICFKAPFVPPIRAFVTFVDKRNPARTVVVGVVSVCHFVSFRFAGRNVAFVQHSETEGGGGGGKVGKRAEK